MRFIRGIKSVCIICVIITACVFSFELERAYKCVMRTRICLENTSLAFHGHVRRQLNFAEFARIWKRSYNEIFDKKLHILLSNLLLKISSGVISSSRPSRTSSIRFERGKKGRWPTFEAALRSARSRSGAWMPWTARSIVRLRYCSRSKADFSSFSRGVQP